METVRYKTSGVLTNPIETTENVGRAMAYLGEHDMTEFLDEPLAAVVVDIFWQLNIDGLHWSVFVKAMRELTEEESKELSEWISGQNSDGLGEGFEQQPFAEVHADFGCGECIDCRHGYSCEESDVYGGMCSFDWQTNDCKLVRI